MHNTQITFKNLDSSEAVKQHVEKKIEKFERLFKYPVIVNVILGVEHQSHWAEITCHAEHKDLVALAKTENLYEAIDQAVHKIEVQFKKEREKKKGHKTAHSMVRNVEHLATDVEAAIPHQDKLAKS